MGQFEIDRDSLSTLRRVTYSDDVKGVTTTAHPKRLKHRWSVNVANGWPNQAFQVYKYQVGERRREVMHTVRSARRGKMSYMHDLAVTENHIALFEMPAYMNMSVCAAHLVHGI